MSNFPLGAGWVSVSVYSGLARVWNVICVTVGKRVGCRFKSSSYGRVQVLKIRPMQDSASVFVTMATTPAIFTIILYLVEERLHLLTEYFTVVAEVIEKLYAVDDRKQKLGDWLFLEAMYVYVGNVKAL